MSLKPADKLGPYEIAAQIGAGGMGEVYRARDTKLERDVAIKVLPAALAQDPERLARFEREAKVLAALNHPNIAQIYGLEQRALVMELVEGETLKGPQPLETALNYAKQIADALEAAHEKGITHRDLKPANIMITPAGVVKVLDFGLAAVAQDPASGSTDPSNSPTLTMRATQAGMIMGTAAYMSPEQAAGKPVDKRADIWSFGVVLWEMLTGQQLFTGETVSHVLAAVLTKDPDPSALPAAVRPVIEKCLRKDPRRRWRDIGDVRLALEEGGTQVPRQQAEGRPATKLPWVAAAALLVALAITGWGWWRATRPVEPPLQPLMRLDVDLGPDVSLGTGPDAIFSPDGGRLAFLSQGRIFTRRLDQPKATELPGTQGATSPFFSPDGQWVAFFSQGKLRRISVEGGSAVALCDTTSAFTGGSWGEDGNIVALAAAGPLMRIPAAGGVPASVTELDRAHGEASHRWPQILPGGKAVLFMAHTATSGFDGANIEVITLADRRRKTLVRGGLYPRYLPSGHLLYVNRGTLFAIPFDLDTLAVRGAAVPLLEQVAYSPQTGYAQLDFSRNGTLVYRSGEAGGGLATVQWLDSTGKTQPLLAKPGFYLYPKLSPDGRRLAIVTTEGSNQDIWVYEPQRDTMTRLTFQAGAIAGYPLWTPDGRYVLFAAAGGMYWTRADGAGKAQLLTQGKSSQMSGSVTAQTPGSVTADGKRLAYQETAAAAGDLWTVSLESDSAGPRAGKPEVFLQTPFSERHPSFSPDGRWLAYDSDEAGAFQIYVRAFPDKGGKWQVSSSGGVFPEWSRDGRELFFRNVDNQIMVAAYSVKGDSLVVDKPRLWSDKRLANVGNYPTYDVGPDGKRIAALMPTEGQEEQKKAQNHVIFLENFSDELRRRVPVSGK